VTLDARRLAKPAGVRDGRARVVRRARTRHECRDERQRCRDAGLLPHEPSCARPIVPASVPNQMDFVGAW
jgi:hypothetical protein